LLKNTKAAKKKEGQLPQLLPLPKINGGDASP
jgi:hypothetical protein